MKMDHQFEHFYYSKKVIKVERVQETNKKMGKWFVIKLSILLQLFAKMKKTHRENPTRQSQ